MELPIRGTRLFLRQARRDFLHTGAIAPSSRFLARAIAAHIDPAGAPQAALEAGAGTGALTGELLRRLPPGSTLDIYEINPNFARHLADRFTGNGAHGVRVSVHNRRVQEIPAGPRYDSIVSGLPLNNFDPAQVEEILSTLLSALKPDGVFSYFEYLLIREIKSVATGEKEKRRLRGVAEVLGRYLEEREFRRDTILLNLPPALVHHLGATRSTSLASEPRPGSSIRR